ncbi:MULTISPECIES: type II toxin-antitoxin system MqsA family antitoxin [Klebsiella pneumoniae complex]|nr:MULTISPECIES: type II TA system antitoxin MqsA family protein [Klebsiella]HBZ7661142.1 type II toxin-antitoxin system MqsA family antitoxin [Klebsiella variicola subsp. variicola]MBN7737762.1 type II toxin-antitoxin system MqsA family antitoxin [Klebsiella variicola]MCF6970151.1 type II toxin-antitoxin system MqsA family antitoxin [Klebsiella variicola]MCJ6258326.1 type II toxin-antitoxin system MqsA family antitoxin [Klebsiella pneumoniae]MCY0049416.1 type II toxin-antitoxin system MqsA fa
MKCEIQCPICGVGVLTPKITNSYVEYKGKSKYLPLHFSICNHCETEQANQQQSLENKREMNAFKKSVDGILTGAEVATARKRLGLTQAEAAKVFGGGPVAFSKYESNDVAQSEAMDKLIKLALHVPEAWDYLLRQSGLSISKSLILDQSQLQHDSLNVWVNVSERDSTIAEPSKIIEKISLYKPQEGKRLWLEEAA